MSQGIRRGVSAAAASLLAAGLLRCEEFSPRYSGAARGVRVPSGQVVLVALHRTDGTDAGTPPEEPEVYLRELRPVCGYAAEGELVLDVEIVPPEEVSEQAAWVIKTKVTRTIVEEEEYRKGILGVKTRTTESYSLGLTYRDPLATERRVSFEPNAEGVPVRRVTLHCEEVSVPVRMVESTVGDAGVTMRRFTYASSPASVRSVVVLTGPTIAAVAESVTVAEKPRTFAWDRNWFLCPGPDGDAAEAPATEP